MEANIAKRVLLSPHSRRCANIAGTVVVERSLACSADVYNHFNNSLHDAIRDLTTESQGQPAD